ncbi:MAG: 3-phosphoglycerate dehydrogenase family protein [Faecalibacterium sp.]|nr:3-phosphoglycerate dehydrogenase family protein [Ruminococcus sp.]MCM1392143.1 3-phosphoglycerate dehydrogenase family protein [Ruminococcus sp.]MCM1485881.1 3-phosphoglycerate dehydrogenase family protein [Faecalibacterium sp.]
MFNILTLNSISPKIKTQLTEDSFSISPDYENPDAVVVRSFNMHETELGDNLKAIARAGAGVNNIPVDDCTQKGIVVFNSPGANANAVKELVLCTMLMASRNVLESIDWVSSLKGGGDAVVKTVEKGKGAFVGHELMGKTLGVIGLGAIGSLVAQTGVDIGMNVIGCDPHLTIHSALNLSNSIKVVAEEDELLKSCDIISVHVPLNDETRHKFNAEFIGKCKDGVILLNMSRAEIADPDAIKAGIDSGKIAKYVCDFPTDNLIGYKNVILTPHLASGTYEAEDNCALMAAAELKDYLVCGNIKNSVNFPNCSLGYLESTARLCVFHENKPSLIQQITKLVSETGANIDNMISKAKPKATTAYTVLDIDNDVDADVLEKISAIDGVVRVRVIK